MGIQGMYAVNPESGATIWKRSFPEKISVVSAPAYANAKLYFNMSARTDHDESSFGYIASYEAKTGKQAFITPVPFRIIDVFESPSIYGDHLYSRASPNPDIKSKMYDLDVTNGKVNQIFAMVGQASPIISRDYIFRARQNGLQAFKRASGQPDFIINTPLDEYANAFYIDPIFDEKSKTAFDVYFDLGHNNAAYLYAFDIEQRQVKWSRLAAGYIHRPAVADNTLYFVDKRVLYAVNVINGNVLWQWKVDDKATDMYEYPTSYIPVVSENHVFISGRGYTYAINRATTGNVIWNNSHGNAAHTGYVDIKTDPSKFKRTLEQVIHYGRVAAWRDGI